MTSWLKGNPNEGSNSLLGLMSNGMSKAARFVKKGTTTNYHWLRENLVDDTDDEFEKDVPRNGFLGMMRNGVKMVKSTLNKDHFNDQ